jgi:hypothetical protein
MCTVYWLYCLVIFACLAAIACGRRRLARRQICTGNCATAGIARKGLTDEPR